MIDSSVRDELLREMEQLSSFVAAPSARLCSRDGRITPQGTPGKELLEVRRNYDSGGGG